MTSAHDRTIGDNEITMTSTPISTNPEAMCALSDTIRKISDTINLFVYMVQDYVHGGPAPKRKRPRRVQRKIDARRGFQHYPIREFRHALAS